MIKDNFRILKKQHAYLQTILKAPEKFQKDRTKTVGGVKGTRYLLKIRNHTPRKAKNSVPPLFFEKAGDKKWMTLKLGMQHMRLTVPNCSRLFEEKQRDTVFGFPWYVVHGAWRRIFSRYLVPLPPPTVFVRSC